MSFYDHSDAARMNDEDACHDCGKAPADIGPRCERCYVEMVMDQADEQAALGAYLAKMQAEEEAEGGVA